MNESDHESSQRKVLQNMHFLYAAACNSKPLLKYTKFFHDFICSKKFSVMVVFDFRISSEISCPEIIAKNQY